MFDPPVIAKVLRFLVLGFVTLSPVRALAQHSEVPPDTLLVGVISMPPVSMKSEDGEWEGLGIELWDRVARDMGVDYELREYGSFGEILTAAEQREFDVFNALAVTKRREMFMDFSHPYVRSGSAIAVASESTGPAWIGIGERLVSLDFLKVIGLLILLWLTAGVVVWLCERSANREMFGGGTANGIGQGIWWAAVTMTTVGYGDKAPKTLSGRLVALVWMLASIILISSFTAAITASLTVSELSGKVRGLDDLRNVRVGSVAQSQPFEFLSERGIAVRPFANERDGLRAIVENRIDAFVYDELVLKHIANLEFPARVRVLAGTFDQYYVSLGMPSDSPHRESLNRTLLELMRGDDWFRLMERYVGPSY